MKRKIVKRKKIRKSVDEEMVTVKHVCESLPIETISKFCESMLDRLRKIIKIKEHRKKF